MSAANRAVFLSYASQDADAARRVCEALRAGGIDVWFDADGGLEHGDEWDAKIRRQIKECVLFIPIISANTQARHEGYFRIEWDLAAERARGIASGVAFILPVVIDETREPEALVPDRFRTVQWTRLRGGEVPPEVKARYLKLWSHRTGVLKHDEMESGRPRPVERGEGAASPAQASMSRRAPAAASIAAMVAIAAVVGFVVLRPKSENGPGTRPTASEAISGGGSRPEVAARLAKVRPLREKVDVGRAELDAATALLDQAAKLDPTDAEVWAEWSLLDCRYIGEHLDRSPERIDLARQRSIRATQLDPRSRTVRLAQATVMVAPNFFDAAARRSAITLLEALATEAEVHPNVLSSLGYLSWDAMNPEAGFPYFDRLARMPRGAGPAELGRAMAYNLAGRFQDSLDRTEASLAIERSSVALLYRAYLQTFWLGDTVAARRTQMDVPTDVLAEDFPAAARFWTELWARDWGRALEAMRAVPRDFIDSMVLSGPTGYYRGYVLARLGKRAAAELEWRTALAVVERRIAATPNDRTVLTMKSLLLISLGEREAAEKLWRSLRELYGDGYQSWMDHFLTMEIDTAEGAIARLERLTGFVESGGVTTAAMLRLDPYLDRLRDHPRFIALQAKLEADPRFSPRAGRDAATSKAAAKSVAVLAFKNVGGDPANEAIVEGIGLELISALGRVSGLTVRGNSSLNHFKGSAATAQEKGRQLDVTYLVDGSLQRAGDTVRIAANLTRAATNEIVWSSTPLARDVKNIFAVQEEMAGLIAQNLSLKLGVTSAAARREVNPEAFELYVRARQVWNLRTMQGFDRAEHLLERALRLEPNFARAHAALADVWNSRGQDQLTVGSFGARHSAEVKRIVAQAEKAVALDPESAEAHASLGSILWVGAWNLGDAERELRRAIALNPNYASARQWLGRRLLRMGATDEALVELKLAAELDPFSHRVLDNYAFGLQCAGRYTQALEMYDRALTVQPDAPGTLSNKAWVLIFLGRGEEARALVQNSQSTIAGEVSRLMVLGRTGQTAEVEKALADPARPIGDRPIIELALGRREQALAALDPQKAISYMTDRLLYSPEFDPIRAEPRFVAFLAEIGATEAHTRAQAWLAAHPAEKPDVKR